MHDGGPRLSLASSAAWKQAIETAIAESRHHLRCHCLELTYFMAARI